MKRTLHVLVFGLLVALACAVGVKSWSGRKAIDRPFSNSNSKLELVKDGKTEYVIVVAKEAPQPDRFAAEELQRYLEKSTGAVFPIVTEMPANGKAIVFRTR